MKFHNQLNGHYLPNRLIGDCYRTCIACLLDKHPSEVPHWLENYWWNGQLVILGREFEDAVDDWLQTQGYAKFDLPFPGENSLQDVADTIAHINGTNFLYMVGGFSPRNCGHVVIYRGRTLLWDPASDKLGLSKPMEDGNWWLTILTTSKMRYNGGLVISN